MNRIVLASLLFAAVLAAQEPGSISGVVLDDAGQPLDSQDVFISGPKRSKETTDAKGEFRMDDVPPGRYRLATYDRPVQDVRILTLAPGEEIKGLSLQLTRHAEIHGRVLDDNGEPMPEVTVYLVGTEYRFGDLRHTYRALTTTDDRGEYRLQRFVRAGVRYTVLAKSVNFDLPAISDAPLDPEARRPAFVPTFYPSSPDLAGAERIVLQDGEIREAIDIRVRRALSYCASGLLQAGGAPAALKFLLWELQPSSGFSSDGGMYGRMPGGETVSDGRFRFCDLAPGEYRLLAHTPPEAGYSHVGAANIVLVDRDVQHLRINAPATTDLAGEIVWANEAPAEPEAKEINVSLRPVYRSHCCSETFSINVPAPDEFLYSRLSTDAYEVDIPRLPDGWYVDDVEYGGNSILHQMLVIGSARPDSRLRISVGHDGGKIRAAVIDEEGDPVVDADVYVIPDEAVTETAISAELERGQTDQRGVFESIALKPGKYRVLATRRKLDRSPESIRRLFLARPKAEEVEIEPNGVTDVEIESLSLDSL